MTTLVVPDADPADIVIIKKDGRMIAIIAPPTLSVLVRDYDITSGLLCRDEGGNLCSETWLREPGEANHAEVW